MKLRDWIHPDYLESDLTPQVRSYLDLEIVKEYQSYDRETPGFAFWLAAGGNVLNWVLLENGRGIGWNESPSWGWTYYVMSKAKVARSFELSEEFNEAL